jgi:hypothetical protein
MQETLISRLDRLFGHGLVSFLRDPEHDTVTVGVSSIALDRHEISPVGWRIVMGARIRIKTLKEKDWDGYLNEVVGTAGK